MFRVFLIIPAFFLGSALGYAVNGQTGFFVFFALFFAVLLGAALHGEWRLAKTKPPAHEPPAPPSEPEPEPEPPTTLRGYLVLIAAVPVGVVLGVPLGAVIGLMIAALLVVALNRGSGDGDRFDGSALLITMTVFGTLAGVGRGLYHATQLRHHAHRKGFLRYLRGVLYGVIADAFAVIGPDHEKRFGPRWNAALMLGFVAALGLGILAGFLSA